MEKKMFLERVEALRKKELVDVKFLVKHGESLSEADFMTAANRIDLAIAEGRCERSRTWKKDQPAKQSKLLTA